MVRAHFATVYRILAAHALLDEGMTSLALHGNAAGLLFPIAWSEPFGLAMIEAMACGTPVIAMRNGSVPEVVDEGVTGFVVDNEEEAVAAVRRLPELSRDTVRRTFEARFCARRMAEDYVEVYRNLIGDRRPKLMAV